MLSPNGIKAVFYDLDGTLRTSKPLGREAFASQAASLGLPVAPADRLRAARWEHYYFAESVELNEDRQTFRDDQSFWMNYSYRQLLALGATPALAEEFTPQLHRYMGEQYHPEDVLMPGVEQILETLKAAGYVLAVVSNRDEPYQEYLQKMGISDYFHFSLAAGEVNSWKPDRGVFERALQMGGVKAGEAIYVGDNYYADVLGARNAGMKPVLIDAYHLFENLDCPVIDAHPQILRLLEKDAWAAADAP